MLSRTAVILLQGVLLMIMAGAAAGIIWLLMTVSTPEGETPKDAAEITRLQFAARLYYDRLEYYTGVCSDIGARSPYYCNDNDGAYAIEVAIDGGGYHCVDSTGFNDRLHISKLNATVCPH